MTTTVGVLALQGDFAAHTRILEALGARTLEVRTPDQLDRLDGLILPGGESTTLLKLMEGTGFEDALARYHDRGGVLFGTCAGMILLARSVAAPAQRSLGLIDIDVDRNAYGRQIDSFEAEAEWVEPALIRGDGVPDRQTAPEDSRPPVAGRGTAKASRRSGTHTPTAAGPRHVAGEQTPGEATDKPLPLVFIRAPRLGRHGEGVMPLVRCRGDVVMARQDRVLVASFHPEISGDDRVHRYLLGVITASLPVISMK